MPFAVTTSHHASPDRIARARTVAERCGVPLVPRAATRPQTFAAAGVDVLYVVANHRDELFSRDGESITIAAGLLRTRVHNGMEHPFVRALAPDGVRPESVFDATLGLAMDALHLAAILEVPILGSEASPAVFSLLEEGLARLSHDKAPTGPAARLIQPTLGRAADVLRAMGPRSVDVVSLSPMFASPRKAPPGYAVFREVAVSEPLGGDTVEAAITAARKRVVLKLRRDEPAPAAWPAEHTRIIGRAVEYRVVECG
ncbi:MAG: hypothetical protein ACI8PZ_003932 [Myxococcota bacterium]|jgi:hypothetical protein